MHHPTRLPTFDGDHHLITPTWGEEDGIGRCAQPGVLADDIMAVLVGQSAQDLFQQSLEQTLEHLQDMGANVFEDKSYTFVNQT